MVDSVKGYLFTAQQMSRDLITLSGSGKTISIKGVVRKQNQKIAFSSSTLLNYNVFVHSGKVYRVDDVSILKEGQYEVSANLDVLSTIYYNSGSVTIQSQRNHLPSRCINREWGGNQVSDWREGIGLTFSGSSTPVMFVCWTSSHNTKLNTNGDLIRYCCPIIVGSSLTTDWMIYEGSVIVDGNIYKYPSIAEIMGSIDDVTGLDGTSILDVSYMLVSPYVYNATTKKFKDLANDDISPNCIHDRGSTTYAFYQIDQTSFNLNLSLQLTPPVHITISPSSVWPNHINRDYYLFIEGRKTMELVPYENVVDYWITPYHDPSGCGYIVSQNENVTYAKGSTLPWIGDAYKTYQIQKKGTDEAKMWYDTVKGIANVGIGVGGAGMSGGMTAMSVPGSVASLGDPIANQIFTEEYMRKVPYGSGTPYGDLASLQFLRQIGSSDHSPVGVEVIEYNGEPTNPSLYGLNNGFPSRGVDTIASGGLYQGVVSTVTSSLNLNQAEIDLLKDRISRGVRT